MRRRAGERKLDFLGTSSGTEVGVVLREPFPDRVRAIALDGNINPTAWSHPLSARNGGRSATGQVAGAPRKSPGSKLIVQEPACPKSREPVSRP
jgi:pimeloyl-ACP methyl ester carboxylesterase